MVATPDIICWGDASDFDNVKAPAKQRQQIRYPSFPSKNREEALRQDPVRAKPPRIYLRQHRRYER